jgi:hypothetical protein
VGGDGPDTRARPAVIKERRGERWADGVCVGWKRGNGPEREKEEEEGWACGGRRAGLLGRSGEKEGEGGEGDFE